MIEELAKEYDQWHQRVFDSCPGHPDENSPWYDLVLEKLVPVKGKRILEVACGRGGFVKFLASRGARAFGADFSFVALRIGRQKTQHTDEKGGSISLAQADAHHLPYLDSSFDIVISCETLEHLLDPLAGLREMVRVLKPGGLIYVTTPNYANLMGLYRFYLLLRGRESQIFLDQPFDRWLFFFQTRRFLRRTGCQIIGADGTVHQIPVPRREPVRVSALESNRRLRRWLSPFAFHYLVVGRKAEAKRRK